MINGETVRRKLEAADNRIGKLARAEGSGRVDPRRALPRRALPRSPRRAERRSMLAHVRKAASPREAWEDMAWAIINSKEFLLRH